MSLADEIQKLQELKDQGALTDEEFQKAKSRAIGLDAAAQRASEMPPSKKSGGCLKTVLWTVVALVVAFFALGAYESHKSTSPSVAVVSSASRNTARYTGVMRIDSGTEYVALNEPSSIGGGCDGWNAVAIQKPGAPSTAMKGLICWKLIDGKMAITDKFGSQRTAGPVSAWSD